MEEISLSKTKPPKDPVQVRATDPRFRGSTLEVDFCETELITDEDFARAVDEHATPEVDDGRPVVVIRDMVFAGHIHVTLDDTKFATKICPYRIVFRNCVFQELLGLPPSVYVSSTVAFEDCTFSTGTVVHAGRRSDLTFRYPSSLSMEVRGTDSIDMIPGTQVSFDHADGVQKLYINYVREATVHDGTAPYCVSAYAFCKLTLARLGPNNRTGTSVSVYKAAGYRPQLSFDRCSLDPELSTVSVNDSADCAVSAVDSELGCLHVVDSVLRSFYLERGSIRVLSATGSICKQWDGDLPGFAASIKSLGFPETPAVLYKKVRIKYPDGGPALRTLLKLEVPAGALKCYSTYNAGTRGKIRVSEARVVSMVDSDGNPCRKPFLASLSSINDPSFKYRIGKTVRPKTPFLVADEVCAPGIHGFLSVEEAANYE